MEADLAMFAHRESPIFSYEHMFLERYVIEDLIAQERARTERARKCIALVSCACFNDGETFRADAKENRVTGLCVPGDIEGSNNCLSQVWLQYLSLEPVDRSKELCNFHATRFMVQLHGCTHLKQLPLLHEGNLIGHSHGLNLVMGDIEHGEAELFRKLSYLSPYIFSQAGIQITEGFVH